MKSWVLEQGEVNIDYELWTDDFNEHICGLERLNEKFLPLIVTAPDLYKALAFYIEICGNTAHQISKETAKEMYEMGIKALTKAQEI